jgi:hypothetical protein
MKIFVKTKDTLLLERFESKDESIIDTKGNLIFKTWSYKKIFCCCGKLHTVQRKENIDGVIYYWINKSRYCIPEYCVLFKE